MHAAADDRVRFLGGVWDQELLDQLYANATTYLHGHSVGGTNPSLLRAIGAGAAVNAFDVDFNREVLGRRRALLRHRGRGGRPGGGRRARTRDDVSLRGEGQPGAGRLYDWDEVAGRYEQLCAGGSPTGPAAAGPAAGAPDQHQHIRERRCPRQRRWRRCGQRPGRERCG